MHRHRIDPLSAALGLTAGVCGVMVAAGRAESIVDKPVLGVAVGALLVGIAIVPWRRRDRRTEPDGDRLAPGE